MAVAERLDLKSIIDTSVAAIKPKFTDVPQARILDFLRDALREPGLALSNVRGGGDKAGASSGIVMFTLNHPDGTHEDLVLRYAPMHNALRIFADYNIAGQFRLQRKLRAAGLPVPRPRLLDADGSRLGLPGFFMEAVEGQVADGSPFTGGLFAEADDTGRLRLFEEVVRAQHAIHSADWQRLGLHEDVCSGEGRTPIEQFIAWCWKTAEWIGPAQMDRLRRVRDWLIANQPAYHRDDHTLVHGDPGLGNYMFRNDRIVTILDWELAAVLSPAYDVAIFCGMADYFRASADAATARMIPTSEEWIALYERVNHVTLRDFEYFLKLSTLPSLVVSLSMNRSMPLAMAKRHLEMMEAMWSIVEC